MKLRIAAVGRLKEPHWRAACDEYLKRLRPYATVEVAEVADRDITYDAPRAMATEGADLLKTIPEASYVVALDLGGDQVTSEGLSARLADLMVGGRSDVTFVIGGSAGLAPAVLRRADERLSLSRMTLPHQLARVVVLEQLYRSFRIMRNEPYHL
ncbi:MAG TPA: 23S rRNA (pseudouridine(1915)-N(3))-methyltransferase RlmH [Coriobacteriia bacterium]